MSSGSDSDQNQKPKKPSTFTVDTTQSIIQEMPSIARLLNRKKPQKQKFTRSEKDNLPRGIPEEIPTDAPQPKAQPVTKRARRVAKTSISPLNQWDSKMLEKTTDPLGRGLKILFDLGALSALFLTIRPQTPTSPGAPKSDLPVFVANAIAGSMDKSGLWTGLTWDPKVIPEIWSQFISSGVVEFPPPGDMTNMQSERNAARSAFGLQPDEWLLLIRTGPQDACRGILAMVSLKSLSEHLAQALPLISAPVQKVA